MKRLLAIGLIWMGCAIAWVILGSTILARTNQNWDARSGEVYSLWGPRLAQHPPQASYSVPKTVKEWTYETNARGESVRVEKEKAVDPVVVSVPLDGSDIHQKFSMEYRRKGLMWFPAYEVEMTARYTFANETTEPRKLDMSFPLSSTDTIYDAFRITDASGQEVRVDIKDGTAKWTDSFPPQSRQDYTVHYRARGTSSFWYHPSVRTERVRNFKLVIDADFTGVDFPAGTLSPSKHASQNGSWHGEWAFDSLISSSPIGIELPERINPGPLASKITFFAPASLLFFFFVVAVLASAKRVNIHPLNYFFFGTAFFAFHLLFAYLVDHISIAPAFALSSLVSILLVVTYARLFVGWRFALLQMGISQFIYLVLFSFTFLWNGFTGLAITIGAIVTLFVMMQVTGRVRWAQSLGEAPLAQD